MTIQQRIRTALLLCWTLLYLSIAHASDTLTYIHNDPSGSPVIATDAQGRTIWKESYRPYGDRLRKEAASNTNTLWFSGKPADTHTGLSYFGARYYDPVLGRFVGVDPAAFDPDNLHSFNRYTYANNNPYRYVDPDGHSPVDVVFFVYDLGKLGTAIYTGTGVLAAGSDLLMSTVGVVSPVPGAGQALKAARAVDDARGAKRVVIGESQTRVDDFARTIGGETISDWLKHTGKEWNPDVNKQWLQQMKEEGASFYDIGPDFNRRLMNRTNSGSGRPSSQIYGSERQGLSGYGDYTKLYERSGKYEGGVPAFDR